MSVDYRTRCETCPLLTYLSLFVFLETKFYIQLYTIFYCCTVITIIRNSGSFHAVHVHCTLKHQVLANLKISDWVWSPSCRLEMGFVKKLEFKKLDFCNQVSGRHEQSSSSWILSVTDVEEKISLMMALVRALRSCLSVTQLNILQRVAARE